MADGWAKNWEVVKDEWVDFIADQKYNWKRLISEPWKRKPHILVAFISTTYKELPRTFTYLTLIAGVAYLAGKAF